MSNFSSFIMTDEGRKIVAKANAEQENCILYTKFICTDTRYNKEQLSTLKDIENPKQVINVQNVKYEAPDKARVTGKLSSSDLDNGYYLYTVGVYAKNKLDNKEVLYAVTIETEPEKVNWISSKNDLNVVDTIITAIFVISKAELSSVEVLPGDTVSQIVFDEHVNNKGRDEVHGATNEAENGMIISRDEEGSAKINMPTEPQDTTIVNKKYIDDKLADIDTDIDKSKVINIYNAETTYNPGDYVAMEFEVEDPPVELFAYKVFDKNGETEINKLYYYENQNKKMKYLSITGIPINLNISDSTTIPTHQVLIPMLVPVSNTNSKELVSILIGSISEKYTEDVSGMNDIQLAEYFNKALQKYKPLFNNYRYKYVNGQINKGDAVENNKLIVNNKQVRGFIDFNLQKSETGLVFHYITMYIDREDWDYELMKQGITSINLPQIEYKLDITEKMKKLLISFYANNNIYTAEADLEKKTVDVMNPIKIQKISNDNYRSAIFSSEDDLSKIFEINSVNDIEKKYEAGKLNGMDIKIYQNNVESAEISKRLFSLFVANKDCETVIAESDSGKKYINALYMEQPAPALDMELVVDTNDARFDDKKDDNYNVPLKEDYPCNYLFIWWVSKTLNADSFKSENKKIISVSANIEGIGDIALNNDGSPSIVNFNKKQSTDAFNRGVITIRTKAFELLEDKDVVIKVKVTKTDTGEVARVDYPYKLKATGKLIEEPPQNYTKKQLLYTLELINKETYLQYKWTPDKEIRTQKLFNNSKTDWGKIGIQLYNRAGELVITNTDNNQYIIKGWINNFLPGADVQEIFFAIINTARKATGGYMSINIPGCVDGNKLMEYGFSEYGSSPLVSGQGSENFNIYGYGANYKVKKVELYLYLYDNEPDFTTCTNNKKKYEFNILKAEQNTDKKNFYFYGNCLQELNSSDLFFELDSSVKITFYKNEEVIKEWSDIRNGSELDSWQFTNDGTLNPTKYSFDFEKYGRKIIFFDRGNTEPEWQKDPSVPLSVTKIVIEKI